MNESRFNLANVDLNLLVNLLALIEERSVTVAADRVGLSQPAMSHALRRLRVLLGDQILVREGTRNRLTPRAAALLGPLRSVLNQVSTLIAEEPFNPATSTRTLTIAGSASVGYVLSAGLTRIMAEEAPGMQLRYVATNDLSDDVFVELGADARLLSEGYHTDHERTRIFDDTWVVYSGVPELTRGSVEKLLATWPHVGLTSVEVPPPYQVLRRMGIEPRVVARVNDYLLAPPMMTGLPRISLHRRSVLERMAPGRELYFVDFPYPTSRLGVDMVWNPWVEDSRFKAWVKDLLIRAAG